MDNYIEHEVEDYELIRNPYPFEKFIEKQLPTLEPQSKKLYEDMKKLAHGNLALAYYLYENKHLSNKTKRSFIHTFNEFMNKQKSFDIMKLRSFYSEKDVTEELNKNTLKKKWKQWKSLANVWFDIKSAAFPTIKFSSNKRGNEEDHPAVPKEEIEQMWQDLNANGNIQTALLIQIMYSFALRPGEVRYLRFEDVNIVNNNYSFKIYRSKTDRFQSFSISKELYDDVKSYMKNLIETNKYSEEIRMNDKGRKIKGHFLFNKGISSVTKKFDAAYKKLFANRSKIRPKDIRVSAISDTNKNKTLTEAATLANHKSIKITRDHYLREATTFDAKKSNRKTLNT